MSRTKAVLSRLSVLALGEGAARVLGVAAFAILARSLGVSGLGVFSFGMSLALVLETGIDLGQTARLGKLVAEDPEEGPSHLSLAAANKVVISVVIGAIVAAVMVWAHAPRDEIVTVVLLLVWAAGLGVLDSLRSASRSLARFNADSTVNAAESLVRLAGVLLVWALGGGLVRYGVAFACETWLSAAVYWAWVARGHASMRLVRRGAGDMARFWRDAAPFGVAFACLSAFYSFDQVLVRALAGASANGFYGAAARIGATASVAGGLLALVVFPDLARMADDPAAFRHHLRRAAVLALGIGATAAFVVAVAAQPLIVWMFGASFAPAVPLLRILAIMVAFRGVSTVALYASNAAGRERPVLVAAIAFAVVSLSADLVLLPSFGATAAAWVSAVGEVALSSALLLVAFGMPGARAVARREAA